MKKHPFYILLLALFVMSLTNCTINKASISENSVETESGTISGIKGTDPHVLVFKGIPYAAPPIDELRWKEPAPVAKWKGVRKCDTFGPNAMQNDPTPRGEYTSEFFIPADEPRSEDCLYLNVWTAAKSNQEKRPVIVYIHGGGFRENSGSVILFDGEAIARKGIVFVTLNYRLGIFGFFAHPDLTDESAHHCSGNYGILDQIAALWWVRDNIEAFGGDPGNVTIAGQSAGAISVNALSVSPLAKGLFHRMIASSGASVLPNTLGRVVDLQSAEANGVNLMKTAGISSFSELRVMPAKALQKLIPKGVGLIVDGYVLTEPISDTYTKEKQANIPLLTGWNADEVQSDSPVTYQQYRTEIINLFGDDAETIFKSYPASDDAEATTARKKLSSELRFGVQNYAWARMQSTLNNLKVYLYYFNRKMPAPGEASRFGAFHTAELPYAYDNLSKLERPWEPADIELAKTISAYWVNFATHGDPNGKGLPHWPPFDTGQGITMIFDEKSEAVKHPYYDALEIIYQHNLK